MLDTAGDAVESTINAEEEPTEEAPINPCWEETRGRIFTGGSFFDGFARGIGNTTAAGSYSGVPKGGAIGVARGIQSGEERRS